MIIKTSFFYILIILFTFIILLTLKNTLYKNSKINHIKRQLDAILKKLGYNNINYDIKESKNYSYTKNKKHIYLLTQINNHVYDTSTLLLVSIHELAHILTKSKQHTPEFYKTEKRLIDTALELKIISPNDKIDHEYPCIH